MENKICNVREAKELSKLEKIKKMLKENENIRKKEIDEIIEIQKSDKLLKYHDNDKYFGRPFINYIIEKESLSTEKTEFITEKIKKRKTSTKKKKSIIYDKIVVVIDGIDNIGNYKYYTKYGDNPFGEKNSFYIIESNEDDWKIFQLAFKLIKKHFENFLIGKYNTKLEKFGKSILTCKNCGNKNVLEALFCNRCGEKLDGEKKEHWSNIACGTCIDFYVNAFDIGCCKLGYSVWSGGCNNKKEI